MKKLWTDFIAGFCKVELLCYGGDPNWLGWAVVVIFGIPITLLALWLSAYLIRATIFASATRPYTLAELVNEMNAVHQSADAEGMHAIPCGCLLIEAKSRIPPSQWLQWLTENFTGSERRARLYMRLAITRPPMSEVQEALDSLSEREGSAV
jgi:hypothetical protein